MKNPPNPNVEKLTEKFADYLLGERIPLEILDAETGEILVPANQKIKKFHLRKVAKAAWREIESANGRPGIEIDPSPIRGKLQQIVAEFQYADLT